LEEAEFKAIDAGLTLGEGDDLTTKILLVVELEGLSGWQVEGLDGAVPSGLGEGIITVAQDCGLSLIVAL